MKNTNERMRYSRIGWEFVRKTYGKKMLQAMNTLYTDIKKHAPELNPEQPYEVDADMFSIYMTLKPEGREPIDVTFEIIESQDYDGMAGGYTFRVDIVEFGGRMLGGCSPFNYTEQVWCTTKPAIKERFELILPAITQGASEIINLVERKVQHAS